MSNQNNIDKIIERIPKFNANTKALCGDEVVVTFNDFKQALTAVVQQEKDKNVKKLIKIEKEKWNDSEHCTCLGYAIVKVFGIKYEKDLLQNTKNNL